MGVIFPIVIFFLNTTTLPAAVPITTPTDSQKVIYLVKIRWHTGIIFRTDQVDTTRWRFIDDFENYKYVDVGWGDREFYQHPDFDIDLAVRALFIDTKSTLRVSGFNRDIDDYLQSTDYAEELKLTNKEYDKLCSYIQSFYITEEGRRIILSEHFGGGVKFYESKGYYNVFNTCNTWVAKALNIAGLKLDEHIIMAEQLFRETLKYGTLVKVPDN